MGLLAVMGPSRKDQRSPPLFLMRKSSKMLWRCQKSRTARSAAGKSTCVSTLSNGMSGPHGRDITFRDLIKRQPAPADVRERAARHDMQMLRTFLLYAAAAPS